MSNFYVLLAATVTLAVCTLTVPVEPRSYDLSAVLDKSVCPIEVKIDDDPERIPRRIKMLKCAQTRNSMCMEMLTSACCNHHVHHKYTTECVEVTDTVQVFDRSNGKAKSFKVSVGCTCMVKEVQEAKSGDSG